MNNTLFTNYKVAAQQAYLLYRKQNWNLLKEYFHEDIILWLSEKKTYFYSPNVVLQYLKESLPFQNQKVNYFIEEKSCKYQEEVRLIQVGRYAATAIFEIYADTSWVSKDGHCKILSIFVRNPAHSYAKICVRTKDAGRYWINKSAIVCVEASRNRSILYLWDKRKLEVTEPVSALTSRLGTLFLQIHRSYFINPFYVSSLKRYLLTMETGIQIPVPEKKYISLKERLAIS